MRRFAALLALALAAPVPGCSTREHANPFDPENPDTHGRPANFVALAGPSLVELRWTPPPPYIAADCGYRLFRRVAGEADFSQVGPDLDRNASYYADFGLADGLLHEYRLYYVFDGVSGGLPAEDAATPGPLRPWCADFALARLFAITPDGGHVVAEHGGFIAPSYVVVDPSRGTVWVSDTYDGRVVNFNPATSGRFFISGLAEPVALALDPLDLSLWVGYQGRDSVYHYTAAGARGVPSRLPATLLDPIGLACDPTTGMLWVCERGGNAVHRFSRAGVSLGATPLATPSRVAVDSLTGEAWATSFAGGLVVRITATGEAQDSVALAGPIGVAVDARRGRIWVADARAGQVVVMTRAGQVLHRIGGMTQARDMDVDLARGDAWVTVPGIRSVVRIAETGAVLSRLGGFTDPYGIALDPGR
jgi:DNA-binding beta-propeller fold protein YncE